jgi:hypothetical protein
MNILKSLFRGKKPERYVRLKVTASKTLLSFKSREHEAYPRRRYLEFNGAPIYQMGNDCDTCPLVFEGLTTAELPIAPQDLSERLRAGLQEVNAQTVETVAHILPAGEYIVRLLRFKPTLRRLNDPNRAPYEKRHRTTYYWEQMEALSSYAYEEIALPLVLENQLKRSSIEDYKSRLQEGESPTALALSIVDVRHPHSRWFEWTLAHFLLDGHHKMMAASELGAPISLLSFLSLGESLANEEMIDKTIELCYARA